MTKFVSGSLAGGTPQIALNVILNLIYSKMMLQLKIIPMNIELLILCLLCILLERGV